MTRLIIILALLSTSCIPAWHHDYLAAKTKAQLLVDLHRCVLDAQTNHRLNCIDLHRAVIALHR